MEKARQLRRPDPPIPFSDKDLRIATYNILADEYLNIDPKVHFPYYKDIDRPEKRRSLIIQELIKYNPDIFCLQELEYDFYDTLSEMMQEYGFDSIFVKRPQGKSDGCGIFFRSERLRCVALRTVDHDKVPRDTRYHRSEFKTHHIGVLAAFEVDPLLDLPHAPPPACPPPRLPRALRQLPLKTTCRIHCELPPVFRTPRTRAADTPVPIPRRDAKRARVDFYGCLVNDDDDDNGGGDSGSNGTQGCACNGPAAAVGGEEEEEIFIDLNADPSDIEPDDPGEGEGEGEGDGEGTPDPPPGPRRFLTLGTTHLTWKKVLEHVKLAQATLMADALVDFRGDLAAWARAALPTGTYEEDIAAVLCGDLNSVPMSGVYEHLEHDGTEGLPLRSAYAAIQGREPLFTNYVPEFKRTIDYIFVADPLVAKAVLALPSREAVAAETALPSTAFPSDHLLLLAVLGWPDSSTHARVT